MLEYQNTSRSKTLIVEKIDLNADHDISTRELFAYFSSRPWAMLLDSANSNHPDSRFDIMVADPIVKIITQGQQTQIIDEHSTQLSCEDPLTIVQQYIERKLLIKQNSSDLPFIGGAIGYFGYDLGANFELLPQNAKDDINTPAMSVGIFDWAIIKDNQSGSLWFVSQQKTFDTIAPDIRTLFKQPKIPFHISSDWQANMDFASYKLKFNQVQQYLLSGDCYQINLAQRFNASFKGDEYSAYRTLVENNQSPFCAFLRFDDFAILSVSPERLLQLNGAQIQTKPIKGTIRRDKDPVIDQQNIQQLRESKKDQAENVMIVDLLRNDISRVSLPGTVNVPSLFAIESFAAVHHMVSTITSTLAPQYQATDLLRSAFPGGSITGAPKIRAMQIIDELEPNRRSAYCGAIGYICASGNMDTNITIRTLVCKDNEIYCWAGGGLVADSTVESEYQETYDKVNKILPILSGLTSSY